MPQLAAAVDSWPDVPVALQHASPTKTPTRASRHQGFVNETPYTSFTRSRGNDPLVEFGVGDTVLIGPGAVVRQKWLHTPDYKLKRLAKPRKSAKGKGKAKAVAEAAEAKEDDWEHEDGLGLNEKVGVITRLFEDVHGKKMAAVRWFARPGSIWDEEGPDDGEEVVENELYYAADSTFVYEIRQAGKSHILQSSVAHKTSLAADSIPIEHIVRHVQVVSPAEFEQHGHGAMPTFIVHKVYDAKPRAGAEFIGQIDWAAVLDKGIASGIWDTAEVRAEPEEKEAPPPKRKGKAKERGPPIKKRKTTHEDAADAPASDDEVDNGSDDDYGDEAENDADDGSGGEEEEEEGDEEAGGAVVVVPKVSKSTLARVARKRTKRNQFQKKQHVSTAVPPAFTMSESFKRLSPFEQAKTLLHVSATPESLPCREDQRAKISALLGDAILAQTGTCLYVHGVPGTGKTATVHSVVRALQQDEDMEPFQFVEINGMKISEPNTSFTMLWEALSGKKAPPRVALAQLENHFQTPDPRRKTTVVLVDELDQMITKKQDVVYNFFNWPHVAHSRLIVIAIANTMDLPERELSGKIRSRLGSNRIPFPTYSWKDLHAILEARLEGLEVFGNKSLERIAKSVAAVTGDARRALDVARRTVEKKDQANKLSGKVELCTMADVAETYREMTNYGANAFIKQASLHQKIFLLALSQCLKRASGAADVEIETVMQYHLDFLRQTAIEPVPTHEELFAIAADLHSLRLLTTESQRGDYYQRVRAVVEDKDLMTVLSLDETLRPHVPKVA